MFRRGIVAALGAASLLSGCQAPSERPTETRAPLTAAVAFTGLSVIDGVGQESTRLIASRVEYRTRRGGAGFITYHDLTELQISGAELVLESAEALPFSEYAERLYRVVESVDAQSGSARPGGKTLTRVLFKDLTISQISQAGTLALSADRARLALDSGTLILEGGVSVVAGSLQSFETPHAVLARDYNAMFARGGRWQGGPRIGRSVYLVVDDTGRLSTGGAMFEPTYADAVEKRERVMLEHVLKRAPSALKPFVYALLRGGHSGRF